MAKVILQINRGSGKIQLVSLKCKDAQRAEEIAASRPNCRGHQFYETGARIPKAKKKVEVDDSVYARIKRGEITSDNIEQMLR